MKYVSERANCSAWIVLDKKRNQVGKVQSIYGSSGKVTVNVFDMGKSNKSFQAGSASGGGYDKFTAALSGCVIDGVVLNDHCGTDEKTKKLLKEYTSIAQNSKINFNKENQEEYRKKAEKIGARFANYSVFYNGIRDYNFEEDKEKAIKTAYYTSLYLESGLDKLKVLGYTIINAI